MVGGHVLITGGAGFIGSRVALRLANEGWDVRILDALLPQVHGPAPHELPLISELRQATEFVVGDIGDPDDLCPRARRPHACPASRGGDGHWPVGL